MSSLLKRLLLAVVISASACEGGVIDDELTSTEPDDGAPYTAVVASLGTADPLDDEAALADDPAADAEGAILAPEVTTVFRHPGVLVNQGQLDFVKAKIKAGAEPWASAFAAAKRSRFASLSYKPGAIATVVCGPYSNPDVGCSAEKNDAVAAYTDALLWYFTGNAAYAKKAIEIMNAWSAVLKDHVNHNAPLQSGWVGSVVARAAEIIRYTYKGWNAAEVDRYGAMLRNVYLPKVINGSPGANGNWELSMSEATIAIGVFLDDKKVFDRGVSLWRKRVPAYIYLKSDGATPVPPPGTDKSGAALVRYWYGQTKYVDGLGQETCRDFGHLQLGFAAMINAAETARIQGVDLYAAEARRITSGFEFNGQFLDGVSAPKWLCGGKPDLSTNPTWEIGYNEFANRLGMALPHIKNVIARIRPTGASHHMVWETLTHAEVGGVGLK